MNCLTRMDFHCHYCKIQGNLIHGVQSVDNSSHCAVETQTVNMDLDVKLVDRTQALMILPGLDDTGFLLERHT